MKKITLLFALMCNLSIFSTTYLVQLGTGATWRTLVAGETLVLISSDPEKPTSNSDVRFAPDYFNSNPFNKSFG